MLNKNPQHVHKLRRLKYKSGNTIFFCTLPDCNYKITPALALGKRSICNRCGEEFLMNEYSIRLAKPHCEKCHKSKETSEVVEVKEVTTTTGIPDRAETFTIPNPEQWSGMPKEDNLADRLQSLIDERQKTDEDI